MLKTPPPPLLKFVRETCVKVYGGISNRTDRNNILYLVFTTVSLLLTTSCWMPFPALTTRWSPALFLFILGPEHLYLMPSSSMSLANQPTKPVWTTLSGAMKGPISFAHLAPRKLPANLYSITDMPTAYSAHAWEI